MAKRGSLMSCIILVVINNPTQRNKPHLCQLWVCEVAGRHGGQAMQDAVLPPPLEHELASRGHQAEVAQQ